MLKLRNYQNFDFIAKQFFRVTLYHKKNYNRSSAFVSKQNLPRFSYIIFYAAWLQMNFFSSAAS
jgi:hypothetical protein